MENVMFSEETDSEEELEQTCNIFDNDQSGDLSTNEMSSEDASDKSQPEKSYTNLQYNGISYDKLSAEDLIGVKFDTVEEADTFYYAYDKAVGFDVRKDDKRMSSRIGRVTIRTWVHEAHLMRSHRFLLDSHLALATSMRAVSIKTSHEYQFMADVSEGIAKVGFTPKDLHNRLGTIRHETVQVGDAEAMLAYFKGKSVEDKQLFCKCSTYENNRLGSIFWRDCTPLLDYSCFGDVMVFVSTYKTNQYGKPLVLFVGSNNHLLTTVFGFALLVDETTETYIWTLQMFLESMEGKKQIAILTDGDEAMKKAIEVVVPSCPHRLCMGHISKNAQRNLRSPKIVAEFRCCMFDETTPDGFEQRWKAMVSKYGIQDRNWVKMMYDKRQSWAEAFVSGKFFARMRSTQLCEGMNRYFKEDLSTSGVSLVELVRLLNKSLERQRHKVVEADFRSNNSTRIFTTDLLRLEKHASTIFTDNVFQLICVEICRVGGLITSRIMHYSSCRVYLTSSYDNDEENECTATYYHQEHNQRLVCSCRLFECEGIPCSRLFNVMKHERMTEIPKSLQMKRWTKEAKSDVESTMVDVEVNIPNKAVHVARHGDLSYLGRKISYLASQTKKGIDILKKELNILEPILGEYLKQQKEVVVSPHTCPNIIRDPVRVRSKGMQGSKDNKLKTKPKCRLCKNYGHNKTTCPKKNRLRGRARVVARNYARCSNNVRKSHPTKKTIKQ